MLIGGMSWILSNIASFNKGILTAVKNTLQFFINISTFITNFFTQIGSMIGYLLRASVTGSSLISTLPSFLVVFATATLTVLIAYKILGRRH